MSEEKECQTVRAPVEAVVMKPCPFCGGFVSADDIISLDRPISGNGTHHLDCCSDMTWDYLLDDHCHKRSVNRKDKTKAKLIERWNKRSS